MLKNVIKNLWFSEKESDIYLAWLQTGLAPASSIARISWHNRVTVYGILNEFVDDWLASKNKKSWTIYFQVINPDELLKMQEFKANHLKKHLPDFYDLMKNDVTKSSVFQYSWLEEMKELYFKILSTTESFSTFLWTKDIDKNFEEFLKTDFLEYRKTINTKARAIVSHRSWYYSNFNKKSHNSVIVDDPIFDIANEVIIYDYDKVAICLFSSEEMSATVIQSKTFHDCMLWIFNVLFNNLKWL